MIDTLEFVGSEYGLWTPGIYCALWWSKRVETNFATLIVLWSWSVRCTDGEKFRATARYSRKDLTAIAAWHWSCTFRTIAPEKVEFCGAHSIPKASAFQPFCSVVFSTVFQKPCTPRQLLSTFSTVSLPTFFSKKACENDLLPGGPSLWAVGPQQLFSTNTRDTNKCKLPGTEFLTLRDNTYGSSGHRG